MSELLQATEAQVPRLGGSGWKWQGKVPAPGSGITRPVRLPYRRLSGYDALVAVVDDLFAPMKPRPGKKGVYLNIDTTFAAAWQIESSVALAEGASRCPFAG